MATSAKDWKAKAHADLPLPSGNTCRVRRISLETLMSRGSIPNSLMGIVKKAFEGKRPEAKDLQELDAAAISDTFRLYDIVTVACVVEPAVSMPPEDDKDRDDDTLYVDEVDMEDKAFIFQWAVGGTADVEKFRQQSSSVLGALSEGEAVRDSTESPVGD